MSTFFSESPDSPIGLDMTSTIRDCGRDVGFSANSASRQAPSTVAPDAQIAPWLSPGPPDSRGISIDGKAFDEKHGKGQNQSPSARPDTRASDFADPMFYGNERRPSMASATTISSQNSTPISRASTNHHRKIAGFFGDDGQDSSRSSDTSVMTSGQRDHSASSQSRKNRHNSVQTNGTDGRPTSPPSSRPRSPLPSSDVTPWLFQDFKVSPRDYVCDCTTQSI